jgi:hypothetical protein
LPVATHAHSSLALDGAPIEFVLFGTDTFSVAMDSADATSYLADFKLGTKIDLLTLDEFITVDGTMTENELEFAKDVVEKYHFTVAGKLTSEVTFLYKKLTITECIPVGSGNEMPEPSSAALLAASLLEIVSLSRRKVSSELGRFSLPRRGESGCQNSPLATWKAEAMIKDRKQSKKKPQKGKKLEAKKALFVAVEHGSLGGDASGGDKYLTMKLNAPVISSVK